MRRIGEERTVSTCRGCVGEWGTEALEFVADMASSRARDAPPVLLTLSVSCVAEEVDKDVVSVMRQGVRGFSGRGSARRLGRR